MILTKSTRDVERVRHRGSPAQGPQTYVTSYLGPSRGQGGPDDDEPPPLGVLYPVAYVIEQPPNNLAPPHFHQADQFQVVVSGEGAIGKHPVPAVSVHFASAYTPYGPLRSGPDGFAYMTMRNGFDPRSMPMPRERELLKRAGRKPRAAFGERIAPLSERELLALDAPTSRLLLEEQPDALGAWLYRVPPNAVVSGPDPHGGGGQFWLVLRGELAVDGRPSLPERSCAFVSPDEMALNAKASAGGCEVLALQFP